MERKLIIIIGVLCAMLLVACDQSERRASRKIGGSGMGTQVQQDAEANKEAEKDSGNEVAADATADAGQAGQAAATDAGDRDGGTSIGDAAADAEQTEQEEQADSGKEGARDSSADATAEAGQAGDDRDSGAADSGPTNVFNHFHFDTMVTAAATTRVEPWDRPEWSRESVAWGKFVRPNGTEYTMLVYEKRPREIFREWMARSEVGDSVMSNNRIQTASGHDAYLYTTNDYGAAADVHITAESQRFVYYFHSDVTQMQIPADFEQFVRELRLLN